MNALVCWDISVPKLRQTSRLAGIRDLLELLFRLSRDRDEARQSLSRTRPQILFVEPFSLN